MAVDLAWLEQVRQRNRARFGMDASARQQSQSMNGLGYVSAQALADALYAEREARTTSLHRGRLERTDPSKPAEGSIESIAQALGPEVMAPPPAQASGPSGTLIVGGAIALGIIGLILFMRRE